MVQLPQQTGLFISRSAQRQEAFQRACAELFGRLLLADDAADAERLLAANQVDLLVLDLERCEPALHLPGLEALLGARGGLPALLLCPWDRAGWLAPLVRFPGTAYAIGPLEGRELANLVAARLAAAEPVAAQELAALLAMQACRAQLQKAFAFGAHAQAVRACEALVHWPGAVHAAIYELAGDGELRLAAQHGVAGLDLGQSAQDVCIPGTMRAAARGELALQVAPGDALSRYGVAMVLGVPVPCDGPGDPGGALCLLFRERRSFDAFEFEALADLGRLAALGMQMEALRRERIALQERIEKVATGDGLTGAASRRHGETLLEQEVRRARRHKLPMALLSLEIDGFRHINHQFGFAVGDVALVTAAATIRAQLRSHDLLVRSGASQFQVIAPHTDAADGVRLADKLRAALAQQDVPGCDRITASIGVAELALDESGDNLALRADTSCCRARRAGGNHVELEHTERPVVARHIHTESVARSVVDLILSDS